MDKKTILIFGVGILQRSIIERCKLKGLFTIGIDPCPDAACQDCVDAFEIMNGQDYEGTLTIARKYNISGIITAATDKPLVMMARIATILNLPFYSVYTAELSTDKSLMKEKFMRFGIPCAKGFVLTDINLLKDYDFSYPVIVKPRDNSGSRGVIYCSNDHEVILAWNEAIKYTKKASVLIEEFIDGPEYSIESLHFDGQSQIIQFTEKRTTQFPYNVELGHIQPANLSDENKAQIREIVSQIAKALDFNNCGSHTELKISTRGIIVIETSPRLGGDYITSTLTPLSTGINLEDLLIELSIGNKLSKNDFKSTISKSSGVLFFELPPGRIKSIGDLDLLKSLEGLLYYKFELKVGDFVHQITSSLNRYGYAIFQAKDRKHLLAFMNSCKLKIKELITIE